MILGRKISILVFCFFLPWTNCAVSTYYKAPYSPPTTGGVYKGAYNPPQGSVMTIEDVQSRIDSMQSTIQSMLFNIGKLEGICSTKQESSYQPGPSYDSYHPSQSYYKPMYKCPPQTNCGNGYVWLEAFDNCVRFVTDQITWAEARSECLSENSDLVIVDTAAKQQAIEDYLDGIDAANTNWWIGANDQTTEGTFEWVSGETFADTYTNWDSGEPNTTPSDGDCVLMHFTSSISGAWRDSDCESDKAYICERKRPDTKTSYSHFKDDYNYTK